MTGIQTCALPIFSLLGQSILSGIFIGALYGLFGLGLSLSWGLLRLINLAHFALAFLGAYLAYQLSSSGAMDPLLTLLVIVPGFFLFGMAMHWVFMRFAVSPFNSLLVTFGITVIIESCIQWIWTADYRRLESHYAEVKFRLGALYVPLPELLTLIAALVLCGAVWAVLRLTDLGKALRAAAEDAPIAAAFGVDERQVEFGREFEHVPVARVDEFATTFGEQSFADEIFFCEDPSPDTVRCLI